MRTGILGTAAVAAAVALGATAGGASAHSEVATTRPTDGARVGALPRVVTVTFGEVLLRAGRASVTHAGGQYSGGARLSPRDARVLVIRVRALPRGATGPAPDRGRLTGRYTVRWNAVSADGHPQSGAFSFRVVSPRARA